MWDLVSGLLYQFHSHGIEEAEEPPPEGEAALVAANEFEQALEPGVLAPPDRFTAYFENQRDAERASRAIEPVLGPLKPVFDIKEVEEKNYAELWKENLKPIFVKPFWVVRASWHGPEDLAAAAIRQEPGTTEIVLDPGMAFGTGAHETTRACLQLMAAAMGAVDRSRRSAMKVLDFGCGSGILAIALCKLGVGHVMGVDIDPLAIDATKANAAANACSLEATLEPKAYKNLDGIAANILKNTLLDHAEKFRAWLKPGGFLILSGLLSEQEAEIMARYESLGFKSRERMCQNNWVSLWLERAA
jgi:ribosomal protein L11 methyltransferase